MTRRKQNPVNQQEPRSEQELVRAIRDGNRNALADFLKRNESRFRRRFGGMMGPVARRLLDSEELFSSVMRRMDARVAGGKLKPEHPGELMSYAYVTGQNRLHQRVRDVKRESETRHQLQLDAQGPRPAGSPEIQHQVDQALTSLSATDQEIIGIYVRTGSYQAIMDTLQINHENARQRLTRARQRLVVAMGTPA